MSFKGEIALGALNTKYKYGFTVGDIYRVQGAGNLVPNNLAVVNGAFVEWKSTGWEVKKDMQYATSENIESVDEDIADLQEQIDDIAEKAGSGYTPKGPASVATLNGLTGQENGWLYTMTDAGTLTDGSLAVTAGDTVAWDETNSVWYPAMDYAPKASVVALQNDISQVGLATFKGDEKSDWTMTKGGYIKADGSIQSNSSYWYSDFIGVFGGAKYTLKAGGTMYNTNQPIVFYDSMQKVVGTYTTATTDTQRTFDVPQNAVFLRYSCLGNSGTYSLTYNSENPSSQIPSDVASLKKPFDFFKIPKVYGVVGTPIRIYLESLFKMIPSGIVSHKDKGGGDTETRNAVLLNLDSAWSYTTIIKWYDGKGNCELSTDMPFAVCTADAKNGQSAKCLVLGDSLTASGKITSFLASKFENDGFDLQLVGTLGSAENPHEGRAGWNSHDYRATSSYNGSTNPFLNNGDFDFAYYLQNSGLDAPDYVVIELGTNDVWRDMGGTTTAENINAIIESIKQTNASVKVIVMTAVCPYAGVDGTSGSQYYPRQGLWSVSNNIVNAFAGKENENIFCCLMGGAYDPIYSFNRTTMPACLHSNETITKCTDVVHPNDVGYEQIADEIYCALKNV